MNNDFNEWLHESGYFMSTPHTTHELLEKCWLASKEKSRSKTVGAFIGGLVFGEIVVFVICILRIYA